MLKKKKNVAQQLDRMSIDTIIAEKIHIQGDIKGDSSLRIEGKVTGNIHVKLGVVLGEKAEVIGDVTAQNIVVHGRLTGNVEASHLTIKNTAVLEGDIKVQDIEIENGGKYNGTLKMDTTENSTKKKQ